MKKTLIILALTLAAVAIFAACAKGPNIVEESADSFAEMSWESVEDVSKAEVSKNESSEPIPGGGGVYLDDPDTTESEKIDAIVNGYNLQNFFGVRVHFKTEFYSEEKVWTEADFPGIKIREFKFYKYGPHRASIDFDVATLEQARKEIEKLVKFDFIEKII